MNMHNSIQYKRGPRRAPGRAAQADLPATYLAQVKEKAGGGGGGQDLPRARWMDYQGPRVLSIGPNSSIRPGQHLSLHCSSADHVLRVAFLFLSSYPLSVQRLELQLGNPWYGPDSPHRGPRAASYDGVFNRCCAGWPPVDAVVGGGGMTWGLRRYSKRARGASGAPEAPPGLSCEL